MEEAISKIKLGKVSGDDNLESEMIKWMGMKRKKWLKIICNEGWQQLKIAAQWENNLNHP